MKTADLPTSPKSSLPPKELHHPLRRRSSVRRCPILGIDKGDITMRSREVLDRRQFVYLAGGMSLGFPIWSGANSFAQQSLPQAEGVQEDNATTANTTNEIQLISLADAYVQNAIAGASSINGDLNLLQQQFRQGRQIFIKAQRRLRALDYDITLPNGPVNLDAPPISFAQFSNFEQINMAALVGEDDSVRKILSKILALFGISEFAEVFAKLLAADLEGLAAAVLAANWRLVTTLFFKIIDAVFSRAFLTLLGENIGAKLAAKLAAKIASRFLPFIGWAILIGQLVWALGEEFGKKNT
jgi:hypothetical protein